MHDPDGSIRELQRYIRNISLERSDVPTSAVDGFYDSVTASAVTAVQRSLGLPATGVTDLATWNAMRDESAAILARRAPAAQAGRFSPPESVLGAGDSGDVVLMLQIMLTAAAHRFPAIPEPELTGRYDSATEISVTAFQRAADLPVSAVTDKETWDAIADTYNVIV